MAKIDFGLYLTRRDFPVSETLEYYRRCIRILPVGFSTLWMEDHLQWDKVPTFECLTTLSYLAAEFPNFRLGSLVLCQSYRNPALVAKMAATLQLLSGGRLILGIGVGWKEDEYSSYGYSFPTTKIRLEQLEEAIQIIRAMWISQPVTSIGNYYRIRDAYCEPQPAPPIPLLIGGGGELGTLRLVARYADWWNFNSCTTEVYARKVAILRNHCNDVGRDFREIKLTYASWMSVAEEKSQLMQDSQRHIITGDSAEVIHELKQFCEIGVTHFILKFPDLASLERFVLTVMPYFV